MEECPILIRSIRQWPLRTQLSGELGHPMAIMKSKFQLEKFLHIIEELHKQIGPCDIYNKKKWTESRKKGLLLTNALRIPTSTLHYYLFLCYLNGTRNSWRVVVTHSSEHSSTSLCPVNNGCKCIWVWQELIQVLQIHTIWAVER